MEAVKLGALGLVALVAAYAADQGNDLAFRIHGFTDPLAKQAIGTIVHALSALILNGRALNFELLLRDSVEEETHPVRFEPEHFLKLV